MLPRLLQPVAVFVQKIMREETSRYDDNLHEPIGAVRRASALVKLQAQITWGEQKAADAEEEGILEHSKGFLTFRTLDLRRSGATVERGDKIVQIGEGDDMQEVSLFIVKLQPMGHFARAKGNTLVRAYFADRQPAQG